MIMCIIQNYLLSLRISEYQPSIAQVLNITELVSQSIKSCDEYLEAALVYSMQHPMYSLHKKELSLLAQILIRLGYRLSTRTANELLIRFSQHSVLVTFANDQFSAQAIIKKHVIYN